MNTEISTTEGNALAVASAPVPAPAVPPTPQSVLIEKTFVKGSLMDADSLTIWGFGAAKGRTEMLASIEGTVTGILRREPTDIDRKAGLDENICLAGIFTIRSFVTGEVTEARVVFLPRHYMDKIDLAFTGDTTSIGIDCELGVKATGKRPISYSWVVAEFDTSGRYAELRRKHALRHQARAEQGTVFQKPEMTPQTLATLVAAKRELAAPAPKAAIVDATPKPQENAA